MSPRILWSADYELFLGENFLPESSVLIEPTAALLETCEELGIPLCLFADVACLWRYRQHGEHQFPDEAEEQLRDAVRRGHDVQAHAHPHWQHARREHGGWTAPLDSFLIGDIDDPRPLLAGIRDHLNRLLRPADPGYDCVAFRAGNYGLQPHAERVFAALREAGYRLDSSVVPGLVLQNAVNRIDFRGYPEHDEELHGVYEVPIATARFGPVDAVMRRIRRPAKGRPRGRTIHASAGERPSLRSRLFRLDILELGRDPQRLEKITERYLRRVGTDVTFSFSCHPKMVGPRELDTLRTYHAWLTSRYDVTSARVQELLRPELDIQRAPELEAGVELSAPVPLQASARGGRVDEASRRETR